MKSEILQGVRGKLRERGRAEGRHTESEENGMKK
jgi:hypothetical protein